MFSSPSPSLRLPAWYLVLCCFLVAVSPALVPAAAQAPEPPPPTGLEEGEDGDNVTVVLEGDVRQRFPLAFPATEIPAALSSRARAAAEELDSTLRQDLELTRVFDIQGPAALSVLDLTGEPSLDLELYRSLGNEILLLAEVQEADGRLIFDGRLLDLANGESIVGKRYQGDFDIVRAIAHTFSDEVLLYLTGRRGIARTSIAFTSDRDGNKEIYLMDYDGYGQRRITAHRSISMGPTWAPDGGALAYLSYLSGIPGLYFVDLSNGSKRSILADSQHNLSPAIAPDGRQVAFGRSLSGNTEIYVADLQGGQQRRLTNSGAIDTNPSWSPDGSRIAFTSSRAGNPHIYLMDSDGTNLRRVSFDGNYNDGAVWHPDGTRLAYASRRRGVFQIAITDIVTLETRVITTGTSNKEEPTWSPDGQRIAFTARRGTNTQIYVVDVDGSNLRQVTQDGNNSAPAWSPYPSK
ncbi:MAG: Tol-Pal system beta propeller repeat protein TolB [Acidobacteriota bacterium]|nr:Tol-Pal system beta propeller repeat protein TolB [Acidobacteriota bacterium]